MDAILDTLAASRKLEESGMPKPQADAAAEIVNDAMKELVTKEYLTAELDRRFGAVDQRFVAVDKRFARLKSDMDKRFNKMDKRLTKLEAKIVTSVAELGRSQARGLLSMSAINIAIASLLFVALQNFDAEPAAAPGNFAEPPAFESETSEPAGASPARFP
ncbi:MAG: hypothetical protein F4234_03780 [Gammaproteobacteria bacterium]|nr:hypothetical protein [Gammaproteobacteria bacterium]